MSSIQKPIIKYLIDFLEYLEIEKGLSSKTQENYSRFLNKFFSWLKENKLINLKPNQLDEKHIWKYRVFLSKYVNPISKKNLKKSTQNYYLIALRSMLGFFAEKKITSLPSSCIKLAKDKTDKKVNFLKLEQIEKLLLATNIKTNNLKTKLRDRAILETLFSTGLRVAELVKLDYEQIKIRKK